MSEPKDDIALEAAITREFSKFGTVFVKIKRDNKNIPFGFCQYTVEEDAKRALKEGGGIPILGRECRVEPAKTTRTFPRSDDDWSLALTLRRRVGRLPPQPRPRRRP